MSDDTHTTRCDCQACKALSGPGGDVVVSQADMWNNAFATRPQPIPDALLYRTLPGDPVTREDVKNDDSR